MSHIYLKVDSAFRINATTTNAGSFSINLQKAIQGSWRLKQFFVPVSNFNVSATCNRIPFFENGVAKVAVLTPGYYDTASLMTEVATEMTAVSAGFATYSVARSALPLRIYITSTQPFKLLFGTDSANSLAAILGYSATDSASLGFLQLATNLSNLALLRSYNVSINNITGFIDTQGRSSTFVIPILGNTQSLTVYEPQPQYQQSVFFTQPTNTLNIQVSDDNGIAIDLGCDFYMILSQC